MSKYSGYFIKVMIGFRDCGVEFICGEWHEVVSHRQNMDSVLLSLGGAKFARLQKSEIMNNFGSPTKDLSYMAAVNNGQPTVHQRVTPATTYYKGDVIRFDPSVAINVYGFDDQTNYIVLGVDPSNDTVCIESAKGTQAWFKADIFFLTHSAPMAASATRTGRITANKPSKRVAVPRIANPINLSPAVAPTGIPSIPAFGVGDAAEHRSNDHADAHNYEVIGVDLKTDRIQIVDSGFPMWVNCADYKNMGKYKPKGDRLPNRNEPANKGICGQSILCISRHASGVVINHRYPVTAVDDSFSKVQVKNARGNIQWYPQMYFSMESGLIYIDPMPYEDGYDEYPEDDC